MFNDFSSDLNRGDAVARLVYESVFLSGNALGYSSDKAIFVEYADDATLQYAGADIVVFPNTEKECLVEVKSAVDSAGPKRGGGGPLKTFAHELSYINAQGELKAGWLIDDDKRSDVYVYCWIPEVRPELHRCSGASYFRIRGIRDIGVLEVAMVQTKRLMRYVGRKAFGATEDWRVSQIKGKLTAEAERIRKEGNSSNYIGNCRVSYSSRLKEKPVNLLVPKSDLLEIAFHAYKVKQLIYSSDPARIDWAVVNWDS